MLYPLSYEGGTSAHTSARRSACKWPLILRPVRSWPLCHTFWEQISDDPLARHTGSHRSKESVGSPIGVPAGLVKEE